MARLLQFGPFALHQSQIFFESAFCFGIVNLKPIVPGHVLFISKRVCPRLQDLSTDEVSDLYLSVHRAIPVLEAHYGAQSSNVAMQDGLYAGQSVPHVHVHVLPRKPADFENSDDVYGHLEAQNLSQILAIPEDRRPRTEQEMADEALVLRALFPDNSVRGL